VTPALNAISTMMLAGSFGLVILGVLIMRGWGRRGRRRTKSDPVPLGGGLLP